METRGLLGETGEKSIPQVGVIDLPYKQINDFLLKGNRKKNELGARPDPLQDLGQSVTDVAPREKNPRSF